MKTLKQILEETNLTVFQDKIDEKSWIKIQTIKAVKEWLTQKRQELPNKKPYNQFGVIIDQYLEKELLDSLESPTGEELQEE